MRATSMAVLLIVLGLAWAVPAQAQNVYDDFSDDGQIDTCQYSDEQLRRGLDGLPPDVIQYSPGLADQLAAGREGCGGGAPGSGTDTRELELIPAPTGATGGGTGGQKRVKPRIPDPPAPDAVGRARLAEVAVPAVSATTRADVPGWVVALLAAVAVMALLAAAGRLTGFVGAGALRASIAEAAGRTADGAAELWDTVRLGR